MRKCEIRVHEFVNMSSDERERCLRSYLREGGWTMLDDPPLSGEVIELIDNEDGDEPGLFEPVVFLRGAVVDCEQVKSAIDKFYKEELFNYAWHQLEKEGVCVGTERERILKEFRENKYAMPYGIKGFIRWRSNVCPRPRAETA